MSDYTKFIEESATNILVQLVKHIDVRSGEPRLGNDAELGAWDTELDHAIDNELDASYYTSTLEGALEVMADNPTDSEIIFDGGRPLTWTEAACMFAHEVADTALRAEIENQQENIAGVWAVLIDDTCVDMEYHEDGDNDSPNGTRYWYTYRNQEVACPKCKSLSCAGTDLGRALTARCPCCEGSGYVAGEAFTIMRWKAPNAVLQHMLDGQHEGSVDDADNTYGMLQAKLGEPVEVCEYDPEHDVEGDWRWKHDIEQSCDVVTVLAYAELTTDERAEYELLNAARAAGVL